MVSGMSKFPLLDWMRTAREKREAQVVAPFIEALRARDQELRHARGTIRALEEAKASIERTFMHPFAERLRDSMTDETAKALSRMISKAVMEARKLGSLDVEITVPIDLLDHSNKDSLLRHVTDYYLSHMEAKANVRRHFPSHPLGDDDLIPSQIDEVQHLEISIPTVACSRELVTMDPLRPSYTKGRP